MRFENKDDFGKVVEITSNDIRHLMDLLDGYMGDKPYHICEFWRSDVNEKNGRIDVEIGYIGDKGIPIRQKLLILNDEVIDGKAFHERHDEWYGDRKVKLVNGYPSMRAYLDSHRQNLMMLQTLGFGFGIQINDHQGVFVQVVNDNGEKEYFVELNKIDKENGWEPSAPYNQYVKFGNVDNLLDEIDKYLKDVLDEDNKENKDENDDSKDCENTGCKLDVYNRLVEEMELLSRLQDVGDYETIDLGQKLALWLEVTKMNGKKEYFIQLNRENEDGELNPCGDYDRACPFYGGDVDKLIQNIVAYMNMVKIKDEN